MKYRSNARSLILAVCVACAAALPLSGAGASGVLARPAAATRTTAVAQQVGEPGDALVSLAAVELASLTETHYTHHSHINHEQGVYDTDCSGFVDDLLEQIAPAQYAAVPVEAGHAKPRAFKFEEFFALLARGAQSPGWLPVVSLLDAQPGDILAWELLPIEPDSDTGHVVVIAGSPVINADDTVSVPVIDASATPHDDDTRVDGVGGVGMGSISFRVDAGGAPTAFRFSRHDHFHSTNISIGRLADQ